jgi:hypothetical protein
MIVHDRAIYQNGCIYTHIVRHCGTTAVINGSHRFNQYREASTAVG